MRPPLLDQITSRRSGICLYGFAPPKRATPPDELAAIVAQQKARLAGLPADGFIVYDIQDEPGRSAEPRPFPFLPTIDPDGYAHGALGDIDADKIVYRCVNRESRADFERWLTTVAAAPTPRLSVLVGAPAQGARAGVPLDEAYALARSHAPGLVLGGIAIAERHARRGDEHERLLAKTDSGCRFFVTQAVYDVTSTKSLLSDYALALAARGAAPVPIILTFSPCGSPKTLAFMKWLGISFPRWLDNELRFAADPLATSVTLCEHNFAEIWSYARSKRLPIGINVESVSIRKSEIEASLHLLSRLRAMMAEG